MRTTLTLDDDVAVLLRKAQQRSRAPFKKTVNDALRAGLLAQAQPKQRARYRTKPVSLGGCLLGNLDDVAEALALAEGDAFR